MKILPTNEVPIVIYREYKADYNQQIKIEASTNLNWFETLLLNYFSHQKENLRKLEHAFASAISNI